MPACRRFTGLALSLTLAACTAAPAPTVAAGSTPTGAPTAAPLASVTPPGRSRPLRVWMPSSVSPVASASAEEAFADQIAQFDAAHAGTTVEIRVKQASGPGGLLNALLATYNAAPEALPDLVALTRDDLAAAAAAGLVTSLADLVPAATLDDYYPFAQAMGRPSDELVGLPFAVDARILTYDTQAYPAAPAAWSDVKAGPLVFPGADEQGLSVLHEYLALGGALADASGQPMLDAGPLAAALTQFADAQTAGVLSDASLTLPDAAAGWQVFRERRAPLAVTSASWFMAERARVAGAAAAFLPTRDGTPLALADGWCWALVNTAPEHRALAGELLLWLTDPERLARWTLAENVLPPRAAALAAWGAAPLAPFASAVLTHAQLQPPAEVLAVIGPALKQALADTLSGRLTPLAAAAQAAQSVAAR